MTELEIRNIPFRFDDDVPFQWNPENPEFGMLINAIGMLIISMEKMIVSVVRRAMPLISDPEVAEEARAFLRQEAIHSRAHQLHLAVLLRRYPGLRETVDTIERSFEELERDHSLEFCVAYIAALEATFPPFFKMILDHRAALLSPGDARVASLFAWHFVEEIEHRSSALMIFDAVVGRPRYRLEVIGPAFAHAAGLFATLIEGFERHVPREDRLTDALPLLPSRSWKREIAVRLPWVGRFFRGPHPAAFEAVPGRDLAITFARLIRSQLPNHRPADEPLPAFADVWFDAYDRGLDMRTFEGRLPPQRAADAR